MLCVHPPGVSMSDGDTREVNEEVSRTRMLSGDQWSNSAASSARIKSGYSSALGFYLDDEHSFWLGRKLIKRRLIVQNHHLEPRTICEYEF